MYVTFMPKNFTSSSHSSWQTPDSEAHLLEKVPPMQNVGRSMQIWGNAPVQGSFNFFHCSLTTCRSVQGHVVALAHETHLRKV